MAMLERTDLTTPEKIELSAAAVARQGEFGAISELADSYGISRHTVYDVQARASAMLAAGVDTDTGDKPLVWVPVDYRQLERAVVALRVVAPNSLRAIEALLPILYPGLSPSYGVVQPIAAEAERRAAQRNVQSDLSGISAAALDEMFSQGDPVLGGVDLDSGFLFLLALRESRSGNDWAEELSACQEQGLDLQVVVKDAALGIAAGVSEVFPQAEQRDDCFHALYKTGKVRNFLEKRAYGAMARVEKLEGAVGKLKSQKSPKRRKLAQRLRWARQRCNTALELHDHFEVAQRQAAEAMEIVDLAGGQLRNAGWMQAEIEEAAVKMQALSENKCRKVGRYLENRAPGLALYATETNQHLADLSSHHGEREVTLASIILRLVSDLGRRRRPWCWRQDQQHLVGAFAQLKHLAGDLTDMILAEVDHVFQRRHRASSAIEGFNAALRPFLYVHKGVTQGFLELFRFYYNHRRRRWGRHKGTSAHEVLTGEQVEDWLTELGYAPELMLN